MPLRSLSDVAAPAKLNLYLHIIGRRDDGYHLLQSHFVLIDWCDTLHFESRRDGTIRRHDLGPALPPVDLCLRAAAALRAASGTSFGADISIDKRVPWGSGLGGGSSDAATTLLALNRLWGLNWPRDRLLPIAATIGADVPFFVGGRNAFVEGIGERLTPLACPSTWFAVVKPGGELATADIFRSSMVRRDTSPIKIPSCSMGEAPDTEGFGRNDLQAAAESMCPAVSMVTRWLTERFGNGRMTGSGSAVFARAGTGAEPTRPLDPAELPQGWTGRLCRSFGEHPLAAWAG